MPNKKAKKAKGDPIPWTPGKLYVMEVNHEEGCPTILSQRIEDCTCPIVETSLREVAKPDD